MQLLLFSFIILCFITFAQLITYIVFIKQIPDEVKDKDSLKRRANSFLLPYFGTNVLFIISLICCTYMDCTKWWFMFWTILLGILPCLLPLYIIIIYYEIKTNLERLCGCKILLEINSNTYKCITDYTTTEKKKVNEYCDKLILTLLIMSIIQLVVIIFYFISLIKTNTFRKYKKVINVNKINNISK